MFPDYLKDLSAEETRIHLDPLLPGFLDNRSDLGKLLLRSQVRVNLANTLYLMTRLPQETVNQVGYSNLTLRSDAYNLFPHTPEWERHGEIIVDLFNTADSPKALSMITAVWDGIISHNQTEDPMRLNNLFLRTGDNETIQIPQVNTEPVLIKHFHDEEHSPPFKNGERLEVPSDGLIDLPPRLGQSYKCRHTKV